MPDSPAAKKITQLSQHVELYSEGEPPVHSLFLLAPAPLASAGQRTSAVDQLLIIDPPADVMARFRITGDAAVLFTGPAADVGLPRVQTTAGTVAHVRIGDHFLDVYAQRTGCIVHLPALGVLCSGAYGSTASLPAIAPDSTGVEELDTLRLLARLIKQRRTLRGPQIVIPRMGALSSDEGEVLARLAADVAYLHGLRRVATGAVQRGDGMAALLALGDALLPPERRTPLARALHHDNLHTLSARDGS